ncbi:O-antigen ligase family protein, partial [Vibrio vulnificus]|nr:O-antigen ligase family protein [Vibrio vulnificus]
RAISYFNYIWLGLCVLWFVSVTIYEPVFFRQSSIHKILVFLFVFYILVVSYSGGGGDLGNRYLEFFQIFIFMWSYEILKNRRGISSLLTYLKLMLPFFLFTSLTTIYAYTDAPNISRTAKKDTLLGLQQMSSGIGGYEYIYMLSFILISLLYLIPVKCGFVRKVFLVLLISIMGVNVFLSNFSTALIIILVGAFFWFFCGRMNRPKFYFLLVVMFLLTPLIASVLVYLLQFYTSLDEGTINVSRANEIIDFINSGVVEQSMGARLLAFSMSLNSFSDSPIFGVILSNSNGSVLSSIGQHSFVLDGFAMFGVFVGALNVFLLLVPLYYLTIADRLIPISLSCSLFILFFLFILVNNVTPSIGFALFFIIPVILEVYKNELSKIKKTNYNIS